MRLRTRRIPSAANHSTSTGDGMGGSPDQTGTVGYVRAETHSRGVRANAIRYARTTAILSARTRAESEARRAGCSHAPAAATYFLRRRFSQAAAPTAPAPTPTRTIVAG